MTELISPSLISRLGFGRENENAIVSLGNPVSDRFKIHDEQIHRVHDVVRHVCTYNGTG